jgi:stringent starvation protein B
MKQPGVREIMELYGGVRKIQVPMNQYLAIYADSDHLVLAGTSTSTLN